jgi:tRNA pseudouridine38-40 synthase
MRMVVQYDGTDYSGWQRQANGPTVQQTLEEALAEMTGATPGVRGAGRTDAGVHALGQVAHFDTEANIPARGFRLGLNSILPRTIAVVSVEEAAPDFDSRFAAKRKLYRYQVWNAETRQPLLDRYAWHMIRPLDVARMREAAAVLVGRHDFASFRAADCERKTTVRNLYRVGILEEGPLVSIEVEGDGFLKNMVRILAGTLLYVGHGKLDAHDVAHLLVAPDRTAAGPTAPAKGLTLVRVDYEDVA